MLNVNVEKSLARIIGWGAPCVSIFVLWGIVTDPVNTPKLFLLGSIATAAFLIAVTFGYKQLWIDSKTTLVLVIAFLFASLNAVLQSASPPTQNLYGAYGRNTGFVAYLFLTLILVSALALRDKANFKILMQGLFIAGFTNVAYCLWALTFGDFIGWSNPYGNILGTFGNPNFIGAFLGIFVSAYFAYLISPQTSLKIRLMGALVLLVALFEIKQSKAIQGVVVAAGGVALVLFFYIRAKSKIILLQIIYLAVVTVGGIFAIAGALQKGPLTDLIYKTSVSLRGEYWQAGINMAKEFPLTGVGMDAYGDWFRRSREASALVLPGPNTVTNAAHNVDLDLFAFGGWPLLISYMFVLLIAAISIFKVMVRKREYNWVFVSLVSAWVCYQVQGLISINQIGLAIWGWLLTGAVIAFEVSTRESVGTSKTKVKAGYSGANISPQLVGGVGVVIGALFAAPPLNADMKWRSALLSGSAEKVEAALNPSFLNPANNTKYAQAVQTFESSKLPDLAYKYAKIAIEFSPNTFDSWKLLYFMSKSSQEDKDLALKNMKRLDPLNPNVLD